jgi:hypothetical protein
MWKETRLRTSGYYEKREISWLAECTLSLSTVTLLHEASELLKYISYYGTAVNVVPCYVRYRFPYF